MAFRRRLLGANIGRREASDRASTGDGDADDPIDLAVSTR